MSAKVQMIRMGDKVLIPVGAAAAGGVVANQFPQSKKSSKKALAEVKKNFNINDDPLFNQAYAEKMYDLVSKMDDDSAAMFCYLVACEVLDEDIQKNLRTLQRHVNDVVDKRLTRVAKAAGKLGLADEVAGFIEIAKATPYDYGYRFQESDFRRDRSGRFAAKIQHSNTKPLKAGQAKSVGIPMKDNHKALSPRDRAHYQQEYQQIAAFLNTFKMSGGDPASDNIMMTIKDKDSGQTYQVPSKTGTKPDLSAWDPATERVVGVEARPSSLSYGAMGFNLATAVGAGHDTAYRAGQKVEQFHDPKGMPKFSEDWNQAGPSDYQDTNERLYRRTGAAGAFTAQMSTPGSSAWTAGKFAQLVGQHGPEAEKVIGPHARKTAYRYRGTEKTPDKQMVRDYTSAIANAKSRSRGSDVRSMTQMTTHRREDASRPPTFEEQSAGRAAIAEYLGRKIPSPKLYGLQLAAGNTPPSQGVMLNSKGQIVTEAVGYGDDHYLPFNLKNLKDLKGGEYIRTRSVGGPTSEDIYTGLMMGARQITVVSRSGQFTVTFDETFRGGRRYNDKAMRMTDRYEHLLDAVQSEQVDSNPVKQEIQEMIRREVAEEYADYDRQEQKQAFNRKIEEYKAWDGLDEHDNAWIDRQVAEQKEIDPRKAKAMRSQLAAELMMEKEYKFRLNGAGYKAALSALEEQFPYYITTNSQPMRDIEAEPEKDKGYVMPKHNRPAMALHGYFNPRIAGTGDYTTATGQRTGKIRASEANYQNYPNRKRAAVPEPGAEEGAPAATYGGYVPTETPHAKKAAVREAILDRRAERDIAQTAWTVIEGAVPQMDDGYKRDNKMARLVAEGNRADFDKAMETPEGRSEVRNMIKVKAEVYGANKEAYKAYRDADNAVDLQSYSEADSDRWLDKPFKNFPNAPEAYHRGATPEIVEKELHKVSGRSRPVSGQKKYGDMSPEEMHAEHNLLMVLKRDKDLFKPGPSQKEFLEDAKIVNFANANLLLKAGDKAIQEQITNLHKARALKYNLALAKESEAKKSGKKVDEAMRGTRDYSPERADEVRFDPTVRRTGGPSSVKDATPTQVRQTVKQRIEELRFSAIAHNELGKKDRADEIINHINAGRELMKEAEGGDQTAQDMLDGWLDEAEDYKKMR